MTEQRTGGCQCGAIRYAHNGPLPAAYACHCGECKKQSASAFSMSIPTLYENLQVTGLPKLYETIAFSGVTKYNYFCSRCGTRLWHSNSNPPKNITLKVGSLDDSSSIAAQGHLWVSKLQSGIILDPATDQQETQPSDLLSWRANLGRRA